MKRSIGVLFLLSLAPKAWSSPIYRWIDDQGVTNYTDTPSKVPQKYNAETTSGDEIALVQSSKAASAERDAVASLAREETAAEEQWRARFREAYGRIGQIESSIEQDRRALYSGGLLQCHRGYYWARFGTWVCSDPWYQETQLRIQQNELQLRRAKEALDDLERLASRNAVPREWRTP